MKKMLHWLCLPFLCLLSNTAFAVGLTVPLYDASQAFLSSMFGTIPGVLVGGDTPPVLKGPLVELNYAVMILGGVFILYALVVSTIKTAHEGEMLGKQWNSVWIPIRSALGVALLLPAGTTQTATGTYAGYSIAQAVVMWIVIQGISIADTVWANVACALYLGEAVTVGTPIANISNDAVTAAMGTLFTDLVCSSGLASVEGLGTEATKWQSDSHWNFTDPNNGGYFGTGNNQYPCGRIEFPEDPKSNEDNATVTAVNDAVTQLSRSASQFVGDMNANDYVLTSVQTSNFQKNIIDQATNYTNTVADGIQADKNEKDDTPTPSGDDTFGGALSSLCNGDGAPVNPTIAFGGGWLMAGAYYLSMAKQAQSTAVTKDDNDDSNNAKSVGPPDVTSYDSGAIGNKLMPDLNTQWKLYVNTASDVSKITSSTTLSGILSDGFTYTPPGAGRTFGQPLMNTINDIINKLADAMTGFISGWTTLVTGNHCGPSAIMDGTLGQCNPIASIQAFGNYTLDIIEVSYGIIIVGWLAFGLVAFIVPCCNPISVAFPWIISIAAPVIYAIVGALISSSMVMAYYIPMIPFIVFTFSGIGWLISVVEAMVAAPIVALGILHPEGHEVYGKAEPAVMLLVSAFLKPVLLVVGFIASTELVVISVALVNTAFSIMTPQMLSGYVVFIVTTIAVVCLYTLMTWMAVQKSFTLVHVIPDRALRWIGHYDQFGIGPSEQELQMSKRGIDDAGGQTGAAAKESKDTSMQGAELFKQAQKERAQEQAKAAGNDVLQVGGGG